MSTSDHEDQGVEAPRLSLFRLYTRGATVREDYEWRRTFGEALSSEEAQDVEKLFELFNRQRGRALRRWAMWRTGARLHVLLFDLPSARKDHVNRPIVSHLHYILESEPLDISLTLNELTRCGLGAALLKLTQTHSIQDTPTALIELLDELMTSTEAPSSLETLTPRLLHTLAPPLNHVDELRDDLPKSGLSEAQEADELELTLPSFTPTPKGVSELRRLESSSLAHRWRDEKRRCVWMSKVSNMSAVEGSELPLWWLMTARRGGGGVCDDPSNTLYEELTSHTGGPWWILTYQADLIDTQEPTLTWREPLLTALSRRFKS